MTWILDHWSPGGPGDDGKFSRYYIDRIDFALDRLGSNLIWPEVEAGVPGRPGGGQRGRGAGEGPDPARAPVPEASPRQDGLLEVDPFDPPLARSLAGVTDPAKRRQLVAVRLRELLAVVESMPGGMKRVSAAADVLKDT